MADDPRHAIRDSRKSRALGTLAGWLMRLWCSTLRYEIIDRCGLGDIKKDLGPVIYALWHNRLFMVPMAWKKLCQGERQAVVLTSASHDGSALAHAVGIFGIGAVRGSSSRRAVAALVGLKRALTEGVDVCLTPDGPRGPKYHLQAGAVKLAQSAAVPIIPIHVEPSLCWRLKTWDRFIIPLPFSHVRVIFDEALAVPPGLSDDAFEAQRIRIETILRAGATDPHSEPTP
jgi:lysophospholipid acyltransferase (LPLAT)-like uncharacterized protein